MSQFCLIAIQPPGPGLALANIRAEWQGLAGLDGYGAYYVKLSLMLYTFALACDNDKEVSCVCQLVC